MYIVCNQARTIVGNAIHLFVGKCGEGTYRRTDKHTNTEKDTDRMSVLLKTKEKTKQKKKQTITKTKEVS